VQQSQKNPLQVGPERGLLTPRFSRIYKAPASWCSNRRLYE